MPDIVLAAVNAKYVHPALSLRLLKANLGALEERCGILEFALRQPLEEKVAALLAARPRVLGFSTYIWNHAQTLELIAALRERWRAGDAPEPVLVLGGPEAGNLDADSPLLSPPILGARDWLVRGEGEAVFPLLCGALLADDGAGAGGPVSGGADLFGSAARTFSLRPGDPASATCATCAAAAAVDPAAIDPGYRLYTDEDLARKLTYVEASRGCPFGCEFCLSSLDRRVREFPLDRFLSGMHDLIARGARGFKFLDRTFNLEPRRAAAIMDFFLERLRPGLYVHFELVPRGLTPELRERLSRFPPGSLRLEVGIQTFNPETARLIGRASDPPAELETLRFLRERTNAIVHADLIAGLPGEDAASFGRGFDLLWETRPGEVQLGVLKRLPGAPIVRHDEACGMEWSAEPPYEALSTAAMSRPELDRIKTFARFWELVVNRGRFDADLDRLLPPGTGAWDRFGALSDRLSARFGRSWGIPLDELRAEVEAFMIEMPAAGGYRPAP